MSNFVKFYDAVKFSLLEDPKKLKDFFSSSPGNKQSLRVRIAATHSGKITRNNGFYLPDKMRRGATSFLSQYPKPIQLHHGDEIDPVGRVREAHYIDLSSSIRDSISDKTKSVTAFDDFLKGKMTWQDSLNFISDYFIKDGSVSDDPDYQGLGYIELVADITDPDAIQKILDGRYLTGSVGASTNAAVCSICKGNWAEDGRCEHTPGQVYDKAKCVLVAGDLTYEEYSFVNSPADTHSRIIEVNINGVQDFVKVPKKNNTARIPELTLIVDHSREEKESLFEDSKQVKPMEETNMTFKKAYSLALENEHLKDKADLMDVVKKILDQNKEKSESELISLILAHYQTETKEVEDTISQPLEIVSFFGEDSYKEIVGEDIWGAQYAEMLFGLVQDASTPEEIEAVSKTIKDAKLSAAQRKELPSSVFCGPDRSFPVNDCAHYTAALRLLNKSDAENKENIRQCILRKGKRLGCTSDELTKDSVDLTTVGVGNHLVETFDTLSNEEVAKLHNGLKKALEERAIVLACEACKDAKTSLEKLSHSQKEIKYLHEDIEALQDNLASTSLSLRKEIVSRLADLKKLSGEEVLENAFSEKTTSEIEQSLRDYSQKVDIGKIADNLNSGINRNPEGIVVDPTLKTEVSVKDEEQTVNTETLQKVRDRYIALRLEKNGQEKAARFLEDCKQRGIIPRELSLK